MITYSDYNDAMNDVWETPEDRIERRMDGVSTVDEHLYEFSKLKRELEKIHARVRKLSSPIMSIGEMTYAWHRSHDMVYLYKECNAIRTHINTAIESLINPKPKIEYEYRLLDYFAWIPQRVFGRFFWLRKVYITQSRAKGTKEWCDLRIFVESDTDLILDSEGE